MLPSIKNLEYLISLRKNMHFSNAAKECFVTQSTLSAGIVKLEETLQTKLVERNNKTVIFTPLGEKIVQQAHIVIASSKDFIEIAKTDFFQSSLNIGVIPTISTFLLPKFINSTKKNYPQLKHTFIERTSRELVDLVQKTHLDLAIIAFPYEIPCDIEEYEVFTDRLYLIKHKDNSNKIIANKELLLLEEGHCLSNHILDNYHITKNKVSDTSCSSITTLLAMVDMGLGVSFLPKMAIDFGILENYQSVIAIENNNIARRVGVIYRKTNSQKDNIRLLANLLKTCL